MKRDPVTLLFTTLAVASLSIAAFAGRAEPQPALQNDNKPSAAPRSPGPRASGTKAGHDAATPSEIPARGWWAIAKRVAGKISSDRLLTEAALVQQGVQW